MFGNYSNYYGYRSKDTLIDIRLKHLKKEYFTDRDVLDIGCNAGAFTLDMALLYQPRSTIAIDIDPSLVRKAKQALYLRASFIKPEPEIVASTEDYDLMETDDNNLNKKTHFPLDYFPLSCSREIGVLPFTDTLPITFRCSDFIQEPLDSSHKYGTILALSVTKWIHLTYSDAGIKLFFAKCFQSLKKGGFLIVEPQEWESYKKKIKSDKILSEVYKGLLIKPADFDGLLLKEGFRLVEKIDAHEGFKREIVVYQK